jgi:hypothetical protein
MLESADSVVTLFQMISSPINSSFIEPRANWGNWGNWGNLITDHNDINSCAKIKNDDEELNGKYMLFQWKTRSMFFIFSHEFRRLRTGVQFSFDHELII